MRSRRLGSMYRFCYQLVHKPIVLRVEWWFDGKHFSSLNHMKSYCTSYSSYLQRVKRATRLVSNSCCAQVVWHSWPGDRDKLFCVQSVSECQFHMRSHDSIGAFLDCLPDWAQGLRHSRCSRWHTQNAVCHCPALWIIFNRVKILPHCEHLLWACLTDIWTQRTYV